MSTEEAIKEDIEVKVDEKTATDAAANDVTQPAQKVTQTKPGLRRKKISIFMKNPFHS